MTGARVLGLLCAVFMTAAGGLMTAVGLDTEDYRATFGPILAGLGVALAIVVVQSWRRSR